MAVTKLALYNGALSLLGQRILSSDTEDRPNRYKLDDQYDNGAVDYCLEVIKPKFAVSLTSITGVTPTLTTSYTYEATLPSSFQALVGVYADAAMDQPITRFTHEADKILSDVETVYVRFVQDFDTVGLTNMSWSFARAVMAYLARELSINIDPDETENLDTQLDARIAISEEVDAATEAPNKGIDPLTLTTEWRNIYDDALQIMGMPRLVSNTDDSHRRTELDRARNSEVVEAVLEDQLWQFAKESKKIFYNPGVTPEYGPRFAFDIPSDLHRLNGMWADPHHTHPIQNYIEEGEYWFSDYSTIYIQFVSTDFLTDPSLWPSFFKRYLAARMAVDAAPNIPGANLEVALERLKERESEGKSIDGMQNPPRQFAAGTWVRSRYGNDQSRGRP